VDDRIPSGDGARNFLHSHSNSESHFICSVNGTLCELSNQFNLKFEMTFFARKEVYGCL
jgi:hypothetical protein